MALTQRTIPDEWPTSPARDSTFHELANALEQHCERAQRECDTCSVRRPCQHAFDHLCSNSAKRPLDGRATRRFFTNFYKVQPPMMGTAVFFFNMKAGGFRLTEDDRLWLPAFSLSLPIIVVAGTVCLLAYSAVVVYRVVRGRRHPYVAG
jgi:hypothetical protein